MKLVSNQKIKSIWITESSETVTYLVGLILINFMHHNRWKYFNNFKLKKGKLLNFMQHDQ